MKRRKFIKTVGAGGITLLAGPSLASTLAGAVTNIPPLQTAHFKTITVDRAGGQIAAHQRRAQYFAQRLTENIDIDMMLIPSHGGGHSPTALSFMGKNPVTQAQWRVVAGWPTVGRELVENPACNKADEHPVESVSWLDASEFCQRLSARSGLNFHLPTEVQWEHACRAGTRTPFHFGDTVNADLANYGSKYIYAAEAKGEYRGTSTPVAAFLPNAYGLYDMHGNVWEWCADEIKSARSGPVRYAGAASIWRALRGGAWPDKPQKLEYSSRSMNRQETLNRIIGFRVGCTA